MTRRVWIFDPTFIGFEYDLARVGSDGLEAEKRDGRALAEM
jgi:hypothetical protein